MSSFLARAGALPYLVLLGCGLFSTRLYGYDAVADFSTNANPNGVWSYGWATNSSDPFQLMTVEATFVAGPDAGWNNGIVLPDATYVDKNFTTNIIAKGTVVFFPDTLHMDPQSYAVFVRFTAPSNGAYQVSGLFRMQDTGTIAHNLSIVLNTNITAYAVYTSGGEFGSQYPFSFPCALRQGQTIDFIVSDANNYGSLSTGLKATVTAGTNALPPNSYSATAAFSQSANPNGVWSYLYWTNNAFAGTAQLLKTNVYEVPSETNIFSWWNGNAGSTLQGVIVSGDGTSNPYPETAYPNVQFYPDTLLEDPEGLAVATRFTAPFSSQYSIQGFFRVQDSQLQSSGNAARLEVITNSNAASPAFTTNSLDAPLETQYPFTLNIALSAGATVDFAVVGMGGDVANLSSGVNVTITPEPPLLQSVRFSGGNLSFNFESVSNQSYIIQTTTNLTPAIWSTYSTATGNGSLLPVNVPINVKTPKQFFRVSTP